jgi:hypothetical protein
MSQERKTLFQIYVSSLNFAIVKGSAASSLLKSLHSNIQYSTYTHDYSECTGKRMYMFNQNYMIHWAVEKAYLFKDILYIVKDSYLPHSAVGALGRMLL